MCNEERDIVLEYLKKEHGQAIAKEKEYEQAHGDPVRFQMITYYRGKADGLHFAISLLED